MMKAVIFGMNGVIYESTPYIWEARKRYLKEKEISLSRADTEELLGHSLRDQLLILNKKYGVKLNYEDFSEKTRALAVQLMKGSIQPNPGLLDLLLDLRKNGVKVGIASLFPRRMLEEDLSLMNLTDNFPLVTTLEDTDGHKNSPNMLLTEAVKLEVSSQECVYIDDSVAGITVTKGIGMKFIGMVTKFHKAEDFKGADLVVHSLEELDANTIQRL